MGIIAFTIMLVSIMLGGVVLLVWLVWWKLFGLEQLFPLPPLIFAPPMETAAQRAAFKRIKAAFFSLWFRIGDDIDPPRCNDFLEHLEEEIKMADLSDIFFWPLPKAVYGRLMKKRRYQEAEWVAKRYKL